MVAQEKIEIFFCYNICSAILYNRKGRANQSWHFVLAVALLIFTMLSIAGTEVWKAANNIQRVRE